MPFRKLDWPPWECYQAYEAARDEAAVALRAWYTAPSGHKGLAFAIYRAAADREDAAANAWLTSCNAGEW